MAVRDAGESLTAKTEELTRIQVSESPEEG
jgi:hypothetical protein